MVYSSIHITPAITGRKARSGLRSSAEGTVVDGDVMRKHILIVPKFKSTFHFNNFNWNKKPY